MELRQVATFRQVAASLSFTRAAATLDYAKSSVTAQIQALEEDLGVGLFDRLGRRDAGPHRHARRRGATIESILRRAI